MCTGAAAAARAAAAAARAVPAPIRAHALALALTRHPAPRRSPHPMEIYTRPRHCRWAVGSAEPSPHPHQQRCAPARPRPSPASSRATDAAQPRLLIGRRVACCAGSLSTQPKKIYNNVLECIGNTPLVRINAISKSAGLQVRVACAIVRHGGLGVGRTAAAPTDARGCSASCWPNASSSMPADPSRTALESAWSRMRSARAG